LNQEADVAHLKIDVARREARNAGVGRGVRGIGAAVVCAISGELAADTDPMAEAALQAALEQAPPGGLLCADLSGVEFFDSGGLDWLLQIRQDAARRGVKLVLVAPSERVVRVLEITGSDRTFATAPDLDSAVRLIIRSA
jgi:anti-sigma B factor antagonist